MTVYILIALVIGMLVFCFYLWSNVIDLHASVLRERESMETWGRDIQKGYDDYAETLRTHKSAFERLLKNGKLENGDKEYIRLNLIEARRLYSLMTTLKDEMEKNAKTSD